MKKIICPVCGVVENYCLYETVRHALMFDADDEPIGASEDYGVYYGKTKRCLCGKKVKIENEDSEMIMEKDCFTCANSFVDDDDKLHCMADGHDHEQTVDDNHVCDDWKR